MHLRATGGQCADRFRLSQDARRNNSFHWTAVAGDEPAGAGNVDKAMTG